MADSLSDAKSRLLAELAAGPARRGYLIAYDLLRNRAEAEEAVQEALARACERIGELRDPAAAPAWYLRIVTNQCLRTLRRRRLRRMLFGGREHDSAAGQADPAVVHRMHREASGAPVDQLGAQQELRALFTQLDRLPSQQRAALVLRYGQDLPVSEVADLLGVEVATAKTHLVRGLARLRQLLENPS